MLRICHGSLSSIMVFLMVLVGLAAPQAFAGEGQSQAPLWTFDTPGEVAAIGDDNTGARFSFVESLPGSEGGVAMMQPNGLSMESKAALELAGERLKTWISNNGDVIMRIHIPQGATTMPGMYFFGLADVTEAWSWVGGDFAKVEPKAGWNTVRYPMAAVMNLLDPSRRYMVYLAFAGVDGSMKFPLKEDFCIDGIIKENDPAKVTVTRVVTPEMAKEVDKLLTESDSRLLDTLEKKTFEYFWYESDPGNGLVKDRSTKDSFASISATGFGLSAIPIGIERGWITRKQGYKRAIATLKSFVPADQGGTGLAEGHKGFFYHFLDMGTGKRFRDVELSSIDTALLASGALTVGQYFVGTEATVLARRIYENIDWQWMLAGGSTLSMGWSPGSGFIPARWDHFSELLSMYLLAIGSPSHPIPASSWDDIKRPVRGGKTGSGPFISLPQEPLFVYQYSHCWVDFRGVEDAYANYWVNSVAASLYDRDFCISKSGAFPYLAGIWGLSASDGPGGYRAYGASEGNIDGTVAPYASVASMPFTPGESMESLKAMLREYKGLVWGKYGFVSAFNPKFSWYSNEHIGIDQGDILLMVDNYRTGLTWRLFMGVPEVGSAMRKVGFNPSTGAYAVVPGYAGR